MGHTETVRKLISFVIMMITNRYKDIYFHPKWKTTSGKMGPKSFRKVFNKYFISSKFKIIKKGRS